MRMRSTASIVIAVIGILTLIACGTAKDPDAGRPSPDPLKDAATGRAILFSKHDFPRGWTVKPAPKATGKDPLDDKITACLAPALPSPLAYPPVATVNGDRFYNGPSYVNSAAEFRKTKQEAAAEFTAIRSAKSAACFRKYAMPGWINAVKKVLPGSRLRSSSLVALKVPKIGDGAVGLRLALVFDHKGRTIKFFVDSVDVLADRAELNVAFSNYHAPFDAKLQNALLIKLGGRLKSLL